MKGKKAASRKPSQATLMRKDKGEKIYTEKLYLLSLTKYRRQYTYASMKNIVKIGFLRSLL